MNDIKEILEGFEEHEIRDFEFERLRTNVGSIIGTTPITLTADVLYRLLNFAHEEGFFEGSQGR